MSRFSTASSSAASLLLLVACGDRATPLTPASTAAPAPMVTASAAIAPAPLPEAAKRAKLVSMGRVTERFSGVDACETDADCVVVARHNYEELCPPGTVTNRAGLERDENWSRRGFAFRPPRGGCVDPRTTLRPLCLQKVCAAEGVPAGDDDTDSEKRVWAAHDRLEACQREAVARKDPGIGEAVFTLVLSRSGAVMTVPIEGTLPAELRSCLNRVLLGLQFREVEVVHKLRVPLELRTTVAE